MAHANYEIINKENLTRGRFYIIPSTGPSIIVGGPLLSREQVLSFVKENVLNIMSPPAVAKVLKLTGILYKGSESEIWPKNMFDVNIGDSITIDETPVLDNIQAPKVPKIPMKNRYIVRFPYCMEFGAGAKNHDLGVILVEEVFGGSKKGVWCDPLGRDEKGRSIITWSS